MKHFYKYLTLLLLASASAHAVAPTITSAPSDSLGPDESTFVYQITTDTDGTPEAPLLYNVSGLPDGLVFDTSSGEITWDSTVALGTYSDIKIYASNGDGTGEQTLELIVAAAPNIISSLSITAQEGVSRDYTIEATNDPTGYSVVGLDVFDTNTPISGDTFSFTPNAGSAGDSVALIITAENALGSDFKLLTVSIEASGSAPSTPDVSAASVSPSTPAPVAGDANSVIVTATITPSPGESIDTAFVEWTNPPARANGDLRDPIYLQPLTLTETSPGVFDATAEIPIGMNPDIGELTGGDIVLEFKAYQSNSIASTDFGSDTLSFVVGPTLEFNTLFPSATLPLADIQSGNPFASVDLISSKFASVTARISGPGGAFSVSDSDDSDNADYIFEFFAPSTIQAPGNYEITVTATDDDLNQTEITQTISISDSPKVSIISPSSGEIEIVSVGETIEVIIQATDPGGQIDDSSVALSANGSSVSGNVSPTSVIGQYSIDYTPQLADVGFVDFVATADDFQGNSTSSTPVTISVVRGLPPVVEIIDPIDGDSFNAGSPLTITVNASDADGEIVSVEIFDGATSLGSASPTGIADEYRFNFTTAVPANLGELNLRAVATDDLGNTISSGLVTVLLVQGDVPQIEILSPSTGDELQAGQPFEVRVRITDADGTITSASLNDVAPGGNQSFNNALLSQSTIAGEYVFVATLEPDVVNLVVTAQDDDQNISTSSSVLFTVTAGTAPAVSIDTPLVGSTFARGSLIPIEITASDTDGSVTSVEVFNGSISLGLAFFEGNNSYRLNYNANSPGTLNLNVRATDDFGNVGISDVVPISVESGDLPVVTIDSPVADEVNPTASVGEVFAIVVTATDADGEITSVEILDGARSLGFAQATSTAGEYILNYTTSLSDLGDMELIARAVDDRGNSVDSAIVPIKVDRGDLPVVTIDSPADPGSETAGRNVEILITATDGDGIVSVEVFNGSASLGFATPTGNATEYRLNFDSSPSDAGILNLVARAVDGLDNSADSALVRFNLVTGEVPQISVLSPAAGDAFFTGQPFEIRASVTDDGSVAQVSLADISGEEPSIEAGTLMLSTSTLGEYSFFATIADPDIVDLVITATDNDGNITQSAPVQFTVTKGAVPDVSITSPVTGDSFTLGDVVTIEIAANDDVDGFINQVEVFNGTNSLGIASPVGGDTYRLTYFASAVGTLSLSAQATDNIGNVGISAVQTVSVESGDLPVVTIDNLSDGDDFNISDPISFEITATDDDGYVASVTLFDLTAGGETDLGAALQIAPTSAGQFRFTLDTSSLTPGTKFFAARAVDNIGNISEAIVSVDLSSVPFSIAFTDPLTNPLELTAAENEFFAASYAFTVEVGGIDATTLQSLVWQLDTQDPVEQANLGIELSFSQTFEITECSTLLVTATNTEGVAVTTSVDIEPSFPDPVNDADAFVDYIYYQIRGTAPSAAEKTDALAYLSLNDDTALTRAALAAALFPESQLLESSQTRVALVYKTLTGEWPTAAELESALVVLETDPEALSFQTVDTQTGSISRGATETFTFSYTAGTEVSIRVSPNGTNGTPLSDPTLTVNAPDGSFVGYSDDNFASGGFDLDALVTFTASQSGDYTAIVGGFSVFQSGDFSITSTSLSTETDSDLLLARVLVDSLQGSYNGVNGFLADSDVASPTLAPQFVAQIYRNKHDVAITNFNFSVLGARLTGTDEDMGGGYVVPGYSGDVLTFVAAFALDTDLAVGSIASIQTADGFPYTSELFYGRPNNPLSGWSTETIDLQSSSNIAFAVSALLGSGNSDLTPYDGMTLEVALATIFTDPAFASQFPVSCTVTPLASPVAAAVFSAMFDAGESVLTGLTDDADGDGDSNLEEFALGSNPVDASSGVSIQFGVGAAPTPPIAMSMAMEGDVIEASTASEEQIFMLTYIQLEESLQPEGMSILVECSSDLISWAEADPLSSETVLATDQSGVPEGYERVEFRASFDPTTQHSMFARVAVQTE